MLALMWLIHYLTVYLHWLVKCLTFCVFLLLLRAFSFQLKIFFIIFCMADLVVTNFLTFCLFGSSLSLFYFWMLSLPSRVFLVGFLFLYNTLNLSTPLLSGLHFSAEKFAAILGGSLLSYKLFSLAAFRFFSFFLTFPILITVSLGVHLFGFLSGTFLACWVWISVSFSRLGTFSAIISSNQFSAPFSFLFLESLKCKCYSAWCCLIGPLSYLNL